MTISPSPTSNPGDNNEGCDNSEPCSPSSPSSLFPSLRLLIDTIDNDKNNKNDDTPPFYYAKHAHYVETLADKLQHSFEGALTNHLRLSGVYWSVCTMFLLCGDDLKTVDEKMGLITSKKHKGQLSIVDWIETCYDETTGAYGGDTGQDGHVLYTLSALQVLAMADCLDRVPTDRVVQFLASLQQPDGSFVGDAAATAAAATVSSNTTIVTTPHGVAAAAAAAEIDTRFSYCVLSALSILNRLDAIDIEKAVEYIQKCFNPLDGGYGSCIGAESHAGQVFCCIGALSIAQALHHYVDLDDDDDDATATDNFSKLTWWLSERQCDSGGLNGRSEKQADVCYSWWILSSMSLLGVVQYIDSAKLASFIVRAQDPDDGGIADRPEDMADVFHTFFGISGLSLLGYLPNTYTSHEEGVDQKVQHRFGQIDPVYALPVSVVKRLGLQAQVLVKSGMDVEERLKGYNVVVVDY